MLCGKDSWSCDVRLMLDAFFMNVATTPYLHKLPIEPILLIILAAMLSRH
jgi:hypothetical protein